MEENATIKEILLIGATLIGAVVSKATSDLSEIDCIPNMRKHCAGY